MKPAPPSGLWGSKSSVAPISRALTRAIDGPRPLPLVLRDVAGSPRSNAVKMLSR
jgi:hypothetical protein